MKTGETVNHTIMDKEEQPASTLAGLSEMASREIYENITQCLCLARIQLAALDSYNQADLLSRVGEANLLIGKAVKDLRNLAKTLMAVPSATP